MLSVGALTAALLVTGTTADAQPARTSHPAGAALQSPATLMQSIVDTEDKVQASRRFYNGGVRELNTKIKVFPNTLFVRGLGFKEREFFEVVDGAAISEPPRVQF